MQMSVFRFFLLSLFMTMMVRDRNHPLPLLSCSMLCSALSYRSSWAWLGDGGGGEFVRGLMLCLQGQGREGDTWPLCLPAWPLLFYLIRQTWPGLGQAAPAASTLAARLQRRLAALPANSTAPASPQSPSFSSVQWE